MTSFIKIVAVFTVCMALTLGSAMAENGAPAVTKPLKSSVTTRQMSQKERDKWEAERIKLQAEFDRLTEANEALRVRVKDMTDRKNKQESLNQTLEIRERESRRLAREIDPFIRSVYSRLEDLVASDAPFLAEERRQRLDRLKKVLDDPEPAVSEKFRKVMEAAFIEAEYGATIEVYQEKILLEDEEIVGDIFRLGRISLFFLSLDHSRVATYHVGERKWVPLNADYAPAIHAAMEMGVKHRPVELVCLPLGILAIEN